MEIFQTFHIRRKSNKTLWVSRWNRLRDAPFRFHQTCSCRVGNAVPGCHLALLIGTTMTDIMSPCAEVPTLSATPEAGLLCLGGTLLTLSASLLGGRAAAVSPSQTLCRLATADHIHGSPAHSQPVGHIHGKAGTF